MIGGERFAVSTPLRALHHDIRADAVSGSVTYRASERRSTHFSVQLSDFTDNNNRVEAGASFRQRLVDIPHLDIDGRIELYGSTNSRTDVPYYSPESDYSVQGALHADHVYYRHYDHLFAQQLDLGYGFYDQQGYGARWIGHIRYEHRYRFTPWLEALAGLEYGQNVYDGHAEPYHLIRFMLNGKF
jgi:biofilm PGA synthesis protein PgaA